MVTLLDRLSLLIFHTSLHLRTAAAQFSACLLFDPSLTFYGDSDSWAIKTSEAHRIALKAGKAFSLPVPAWFDSTYALPCHVCKLDQPAKAAIQFWGHPPGARTAALCQVFHRISTCPGMNIDELIVGSVSTRAPKQFGESVVWQRTEEQLAAAATTDGLLEVAGTLALTPPVGQWLLQCRGYLPPSWQPSRLRPLLSWGGQALEHNGQLWLSRTDVC
jgi:hypothetical protein